MANAVLLDIRHLSVKLQLMNELFYNIADERKRYIILLYYDQEPLLKHLEGLLIK